MTSTIESTRLLSFKKNLSILVILIFGALWFLQKSSKPSLIDPSLAQKWVNEGGLLLDVRTPYEYNKYHVSKAINLPLNSIINHFSSSISTQSHSLLSNKEQRIVVYCRSGNRSDKALHILKKAGYKYVYNLGGFARWPQKMNSETNLDKIN